MIDTRCQQALRELASATASMPVGTADAKKAVHVCLGPNPIGGRKTRAQAFKRRAKLYLPEPLGLHGKTTVPHMVVPALVRLWADFILKKGLCSVGHGTGHRDGKKRGTTLGAEAVNRAIAPAACSTTYPKMGEGFVEETESEGDNLRRIPEWRALPGTVGEAV